MSAKFRTIMAEIAAIFLEREEQILAIMRALLAGEHVLLLGPPGTAKSATVVELMRRIVGAFYFETLLTRFSAPEEVFGPVSIMGLQQDKYERKYEGYLPWAHVGFVDEVFKANSAILNSMLTLMAERKFKCGVQLVNAPLVTLVGASNETPQEDDLGALYDRFMVRCISSYVSPANVVNLLRPSTGQNAGNTSLTLKELETARNEVRLVKVDDVVLEEVAALKTAMQKKGFTASDRRWRGSVKLLQACAYLDGRDSVSSDDLLVYGNVLWDDMKDAKTVADEVGRIINPAMQQVMEHIDAVEKLLGEFINAPDEQERINAKLKINQHQASLKKLKAGKKGEEAAAKIDEKVKAAVKKIMSL